MKKIIVFIFTLFLSASLYCEEAKINFSFEGDPLETIGKKFSLNAGIGVVNYKDISGRTETLPKLQAQPTLRLGPVSTGVDIELLLASKDKRKILAETGKNPVIVRFVEYNKDPISARWGVLERITLGKGLIMNNYSTATTQRSSVFTNKDKGIKVSYNTEEYGVTLLGTQTQVYGGRVSYKVSPKLIVGGTLVVDGTEKDDVSAYGIDATVPIIRKVNFYSEVATLKFKDKSKSGWTSGIYVDLIENKLMWKNEFRNFDDGFVPGYFDAHYEVASLLRTTPPSAPLVDSKNGFLSRVDVALIDQLKMHVSYEKYKKVEPRLIAEALVDLTSLQGKEGRPMIPLRGIVSYEQKNFRPDNLNLKKEGIIKGALSVGLQKNIDLVVNYLKTYTASQPTTSVTYNVRYKF